VVPSKIAKSFLDPERFEVSELGSISSISSQLISLLPVLRFGFALNKTSFW
jgi:hypothetical protein